jgi:hypothetical protein
MMHDPSEKAGPSKPQGHGEPAPSGIAVLVFFTIIAVAIVGGYFLLMKLIDMSRQEDCILGGRRNCAAPITAPADR